MDAEAETKSKKSEKRPHTTGTVTPEDMGISLWMARIWSQGEVPERVECYQMFGANKTVRGERIYVQSFKPNEKLEIEQANKLANEIIEAAQNDADALRRAGSYQIAIVDRNRGAQPTVRRLGPIQPLRKYALNGGEALEEIEENGEAPNGKTLALTYAQESLQAVRWERNRNDQVLGQVIQLLIRRLESGEGNIDRLMSKVITFFDTMQIALDRSADRETARETAKFKLQMFQDGWSTAKNLVPGLFASGQKALAGKDGESEPKYAPERQLVENFLVDVERAGEALQIKLFGDWEDGPDGKPVQKAPGIFSLQQFAILMKVRQGKLPVEELGRLMPKSGDALEITEEQIKAAMAAGVTQGMATALFELVGLVAKRKDAAEHRRGSESSSGGPDGAQAGK